MGDEVSIASTKRHQSWPKDQQKRLRKIENSPFLNKKKQN